MTMMQAPEVLTHVGACGTDLVTTALTALAAVLGAFVAGGFLVWNGNRQRAAELEKADREARREYRYRQRTELYGPLKVERRRSELLRRKLPEWEDEERTRRWRLVHHIFDAKSDPEQRQIVERILDAGDKVTNLIREKAGLIEQRRMPGSFEKFILHHELLRLSWATGKNQDPSGSHPFPGRPSSEPRGDGGDPENDLDAAIDEGLRRIEEDLAVLHGEGEVARKLGLPRFRGR